MDNIDSRTDMDESRMKPHSVSGPVYPSLSTSSSQNGNSHVSSSEKSPFHAENCLPPTSEGQSYPIHNSAEATAPLPEPLPSRAEIKNFSDYIMTKDEIRGAVIQYAKNHVFFSKDMIQNMEIKDVIMLNAYHYILKTFTETREVEDASKGYDGGKLDTAANGIPPGAWDIVQTPPKMFEYNFRKSEVPHTVSVTSCGACDGVKRIKCSGCKGSCRASCKSCHGKMKLFTTETCPLCNGKSSSCSICHGEGKINCTKCGGEGRLKHWKKLTTTWRNHEDDVIINETKLPNKLIRNTSSHKVFRETSSIVFPVDHFPHEGVNKASNTLIAKHRQAFRNERIIQQEHQVRVTPIAQVKCCWKEKCGEFFVYGLEKKVHFPDYKPMSLSGCNIS